MPKGAKRPAAAQVGFRAAKVPGTPFPDFEIAPGNRCTLCVWKRHYK